MKRSLRRLVAEPPDIRVGDLLIDCRFAIALPNPDVRRPGTYLSPIPSNPQGYAWIENYISAAGFYRAERETSASRSRKFVRAWQPRGKL